MPALPTCCRWPPAYFTVTGAPCPLSRPPHAYSRVDDLDLWLLRNGSRATFGVQKGAWLTVSDTRARARILVSGRVQGVAYRSFAQEEAWRRGLSGGVRNLADGRVEVDAEGE
ncbi:MAG: acylphosphatase, partial [Nitrospirales bacterium]